MGIISCADNEMHQMEHWQSILAFSHRSVRKWWCLWAKLKIRNEEFYIQIIISPPIGVSSDRVNNKFYRLDSLHSLLVISKDFLIERNLVFNALNLVELKYAENNEWNNNALWIEPRQAAGVTVHIMVHRSIYAMKWCFGCSILNFMVRIFYWQTLHENIKY